MVGTPPIRGKLGASNFADQVSVSSPVVTSGFKEAVWDHFPCEYITTFGTTKLWSSAIPALNSSLHLNKVGSPITIAKLVHIPPISLCK